MDEHEENFKDIFRYTDVEYTPDGYTDVYRWDEFGMMWLIVGDDLGEFVDALDQDGKERRFSRACFRFAFL